jgi:hypothetical protein
MNSKLIAKLRDLQLDFKEVQGRPFNHFFCPVLYSDDNVSLCKAHLINKAFHDTPRTWTVQRADIDHFYGSHFESDFLLIQDRHEHSIDEILVDRVLSKRFNAQILIDNEPVDHFIAPAVFPETFTR